MRRTLFLLLALTSLLVACTDDEDPSPTATPTESLTPSATTTDTPLATATPAGEGDALASQLEWFLGILDGGELTGGEYDARFDESFRSAVPFEEGMLPTLQALQAAAPYEVVEQQRRSDTGLNALIQAADGTQLVLSLDVGPEGRIVGLLVQPADINLPALPS